MDSFPETYNDPIPLSLSTRLLIEKTVSSKRNFKPGMMRDRRTFCEVVHSKEDIQIFALSQKGTFTCRMTNVFFGYGGSLLGLAGRRLKTWLF